MLFTTVLAITLSQAPTVQDDVSVVSRKHYCISIVGRFISHSVCVYRGTFNSMQKNSGNFGRKSNGKVRFGSVRPEYSRFSDRFVALLLSSR